MREIRALRRVLQAPRVPVDRAGGPDGSPGFFDARSALRHRPAGCPARTPRPSEIHRTSIPTRSRPVTTSHGTPTTRQRAGCTARRARQQALQPGTQEEDRDGRGRRLAAHRARRGLRHPGRQRWWQVHAHPPGQHPADPGRGTHRGLRTRRRPRRDGRQAAHQSCLGGRGLLQEAIGLREPRLRRTALRAPGHARPAARQSASSPAWASPGPGSASRSSR